MMWATWWLGAMTVLLVVSVLLSLVLGALQLTTWKEVMRLSNDGRLVSVALVVALLDVIEQWQHEEADAEAAKCIAEARLQELETSLEIPADVRTRLSRVLGNAIATPPPPPPPEVPEPVVELPPPVDTTPPADAVTG